jgi:hypothetical protein
MTMPIAIATEETDMQLTVLLCCLLGSESSSMPQNGTFWPMLLVRVPRSALA